uniref:RNase H type-1 domain-containing protein n=1 Tax=Oryza punctata TaxID=4537 RepID=A0A0E0JZL2_ORYPU
MGKGKDVIDYTRMDGIVPSSSKIKKVQTHNWKRPLTGWAKLNVNGSYNPHDGMVGIGMILRDCRG